VTATKEIETHGADLLRLWTCSVDYEGDIPTSPKVIKEFGDKYRKIRNTLRYLLSNLYDFNPRPTRRKSRRIARRLGDVADGRADPRSDGGVRAYTLHRAFRALHDFCSVQLSSVYGNAMKDRLYCEAPNAPLRRRSQTVMHRIAVVLTKLLAPMLVFTADEAWQYIEHKPVEDRDRPTVHLTLLPEPSIAEPSEEQRAEWQRLMELREQALLQLDALKKEAGVNKALDAEVIFNIADDALRRQLQEYGVDLADMVGAGYHTFAEKRDESGPAVTVKVLDRRETYKPCARSWKRRPDVGQDPDYPDLTLRDAAAVKSTRGCANHRNDFRSRTL
jgi:isoleucyl-tRNA synthetase